MEPWHLPLRAFVFPVSSFWKFPWLFACGRFVLKVSASVWPFQRGFACSPASGFPSGLCPPWVAPPLVSVPGRSHISYSTYRAVHPGVLPLLWRSFLRAGAQFTLVSGILVSSSWLAHGRCVDLESEKVLSSPDVPCSASIKRSQYVRC